MSLYVEITIAGSIDEVWRRTQTPALHERWDLRFTSIEYSAAPERADEPQRFRYATRLGFGLEIAGWGRTAGSREADGTRTSALTFGSDDRRALIREGSGYWKYTPVDGGVRFVTGYDYRVRWGVLGRALDRVVFRPVMGWATAWSFDRLRLWIEAGVEPGGAARRALVHALAAGALAFVWVWHGLVPKLIWLHPDELAMLAEAGLPDRWLEPAVRLAGVLEVGLGLAVLTFARRSWPWLATIGLMVAATAGVLVHSPQRALAAFGPVTLNLLVAAVAAIGLLSLRDLPSARRCRRRPPRPSRRDAA